MPAPAAATAPENQRIRSLPDTDADMDQDARRLRARTDAGPSSFHDDSPIRFDSVIPHTSFFFRAFISLPSPQDL